MRLRKEKEEEERRKEEEEKMEDLHSQKQDHSNADGSQDELEDESIESEYDCFYQPPDIVHVL